MLALLLAMPAHAQQPIKICFPTNSAPGSGNNSCQNVTSGNPFPVTGTLTLAGATSNATSAVATSATNVPTVSYNYGFNGTTLDQLQVDGSKNLKVVVASGGGLSVVDEAAFTYGSSSFTPIGGVYNSSITNLTSGQSGAAALTAARSVHVLDDNSASLLTAAQAGTATTGSSVPASAIYWGVNVGGNLVGFAPGTAGTPSTQVLSVQGEAASGATASGNPVAVAGTYNSTAPTVTAGQAVTAQFSSRGGLLLGNGYPAGSTPITISGTGTTGATTATLATGASVTTYICGFSIRANATAAATGNATVTGTITGTLNYTQWTAPLASGLGVTEQIFTPCIPASGVNTGIAVISAAPGTGGVVSVTAWGYTL